MNRFLSGLHCSCALFACCGWSVLGQAAADEFVVSAESLAEFVVSEQAVAPPNIPSVKTADSMPTSPLDEHCEECERAGYGPDGLKKVSGGCRCGASCPCTAGECGDANCPSLKRSTGSCRSCQAGRARPTAGRARLAARGFFLRRLFGRPRGRCASCR